LHQSEQASSQHHAPRNSRPDEEFTVSKKIDFRSDTVTRPCAEMRKLMANAAVGDDVFGDDPTVNRLEKLAAETTGMRQHCFVAREHRQTYWH
jgi:hypothetical protein